MVKHSFILLLAFILACNSAQQQEQQSDSTDTTAITSGSGNHVDANDTMLVTTAPVMEPEHLQSAPPERMAPEITPTSVNSESTSLDTAEDNSSAIVSTVENPMKKQATMGYSYPTKMTRGQSSDFNVFVSLVNSQSKVLDTLQKIVAKQMADDNNASVKHVMEATNIFLYHKLKVELLDPDKAFELTPVHNNSEQVVDEFGDNKWRWNVKPVANRKDARLILKVIAERPNGNSEPIVDETIHINVNIDEGMFVRNIWIYALDHYEWFLTAILVPLITFLGKRWFDRKKKNEGS